MHGAHLLQSKLRLHQAQQFLLLLFQLLLFGLPAPLLLRGVVFEIVHALVLRFLAHLSQVSRRLAAEIERLRLLN